jgi:hypothetical protein
MIGDDVRQDIGGAMALGMHGVLVRTGKYRSGDEHSIGASMQNTAALLLWTNREILRPWNESARPYPDGNMAAASASEQKLRRRLWLPTSPPRSTGSWPKSSRDAIRAAEMRVA